MTHRASLSSFSFLFFTPITSKSGPAVAAPWITICGSRIRGRNGGSSMADSISWRLIVVVMADPVSRWHHIMVVDHDRGRRLMMDPNKWHWTMTVDYSGIRSGWRIMILLAADHRL
ncbi:unnamed protein product [Pleuronectes platessa]|uniref:Secreted protein n=1 Tax=Pleuronectes platessa TaxID=8262 RepID=A0A9N7UM50_PLEPL|nr:unnamed protein product [Pleuronectes platessa]